MFMVLSSWHSQCV